jgi:hypothetical protein
MSEPPRGILQTPIGLVNFVMTEANHVFLHTDSGKREAVTIRGIPYHCSYHCQLIDGAWQRKDWHDPYLSRKDKYAEASQAARKTAAEVLSKAWTEYLTAHPDLGRAAELAKAENEVEKLAGELADLQEKVQAKRAELTAAKKRLAAI